MGRYRKKPVVVEAMHWDGSYRSQCEIANWTNGCVICYFDTDYYLSIASLGGQMRADPGDWIIRDASGEFYACKPDIFEVTYEPVGDEGGAPPMAKEGSDEEAS